MILSNIFLHSRFYQIIGLVVALFILGYVYPSMLQIAVVGFYTFVGIFAFDLFLLFGRAKPVHLLRFTPEKLSNGDPNEIRIYVENRYRFPAILKVIDEIPEQFQKRNLEFVFTLQQGVNKTISYSLRPVKRGVYQFGKTHAYITSPISLAIRRMKFNKVKEVPVYPSFLDLNRYEIMAMNDRLTEFGIKKIRKIGHNIEFEQIKEYVYGDDYRTMNWRATARTGTLMVNNYQDEKSQQVYCLIDKGRAMRLPFNGMTLLDYAINASLMISNIALKKDDRAGVVTFHQKVSTLLPASKRNLQLGYILETLYNQKTAFKESDFSRLYATIKSKVSQRSLLLLFTNLETVSGMERQLTYLKGLAASHVLVVIFFENTEVEDLLHQPAKNVKGVYYKGMAEKYVYEKRMIQKVLNNHGIHTLLTAPQDLSIQTINKYLELKARGIV